MNSPECETNAPIADAVALTKEAFKEATKEHPDLGVLQAIGGKLDAMAKKIRTSRSKDELAYWKAAIRQVPGSPYWYAEIQRGKIRRKISLETSNKSAAAHRAREVWHYVRLHGWDGYLAKFKPESQRSANPTIGDYIAAAAKTADLSPKTFQTYTQALRKIVSDIAKLSDDNRKYGGGRAHQEWVARVDGAMKLSELSPAAIQEWKRSFLSRAAQDPLSQRSARISCNSFLRSARSLFASKITKHIGLTLPATLPFAGCQFEPKPSCKYRSTFSITALIESARAELANDVEAYKVLLLGAFCGLRRREIDLLEWTSFLWDRNLIRVQTTEYFQAKSEDSLDDVAVEPQLMELFKAYRLNATGRFVIESSEPPRPGCLYDYYRCNKVFTRLIAFLRAHGITSLKPLHALRKEFGSEVCKHFGLFAASQALRHSDIKVTCEHYVESRTHAVVGLGHLL